MRWPFRQKRRERLHESMDDIDAYLQMETDDNVARGMPYEAARAAAQRKFGNLTLIREEVYHMTTLVFLDSLKRDLRHTLRLLFRNPTFTAAALLTLAIGIGANTAVFSVVNSVLLRPLPYPNPEQLVAVRQTAPGASGLASFSTGLPLSLSMYFTYAEQNRSFQAMGAWFPVTATVTEGSRPDQVRAVAVTDGVLEALAVKPMLGRWLTAADQKIQPEAVMLSYGYWQRHYGGDRSVAGSPISIGSRKEEIAGVMPEGFRIVDTDFDLLTPFGFDRSQLSLPGFFLNGVARLRPGVSIKQADADLTRLLPVWMRSWKYPYDYRIYETWKITPALRSLKQDVTGSIGNVLWVVMGTIGLVMIIACANVANLLLVRAEARQQELAVRSALGAGWGRIVRELLAESVTLAVLGGVFGIGIAQEGLRALVAAGPANLPRLSEISLDGRALAFSLALAVASGMLFGLIPALKYAKPRIALGGRTSLGGRTVSAGRERHRARNILVVAQVALALVLLVSAGLMIRTFAALRNVNPGFTNAEQIQTVRIAFPAYVVPLNQPERVVQLQRETLDKLSALPGVGSAAFASGMPLEGVTPNWDAVYAEGHAYAPGEVPPLRYFQYVSPGLLKSAGTRLIVGRDFNWTEILAKRNVVMLSENLAREYWGSAGTAVGRHLMGPPGTPPWEVVGVVEDVRINGVDQAPPATVYWTPLGGRVPQGAVRDAIFVVRSNRAGQEGLLREIRDAVASVNPELPTANFRTMAEIYNRSVARTSFTLVMLAIAGAMALLLGIVGIYGVIAYAVTQRTREIGIRLALGAPQSQVMRAFVRQALALASIGAAIGLCIAAALSKMMKSLVFGVSTLDPVTFAAVTILLVAVAAIASYVPARRAAGVDPVQALRVE